MAALCVIQIAFVFLWVVPGPMLIDEVVYHRMVKSFVEGHGLGLWNGYEEMASPELAALYMQPSGGRLVAQYPHGFPVVAAPAYALFGFRGMFLVNALSFVGAIALCYRIAMQILRDQRVAIGAAAIFALATFAWEYSQAAWPHALALVIILAAASLGLSAYQTRTRRTAVALAAAAGGLAGIAITIRLDAVFCVPAFVLPFLLASPLRFREVIALGVGTGPALAALAATNWLKWDTLSPLSYGRPGRIMGLASQASLYAMAIAAVAALVAITRPRPRAWIASHPRVVAVSGLGALVAALLIEPASEHLYRLVRGARVILLDLRELPLHDLTPAMQRSTDGAVDYGGALKKALLQNVPHLALLVVPVLSAIRSRAVRQPMLLLATIPATLAAFFSYYSWHGGMCFNMRYLLPVLPFTSIMTACALADLGRGAIRGWPWVLASSAAVTVLAYVVAVPSDRSSAIEGFIYVTPLVMAFAIVVAVAAWWMRPTRATSTAAIALAGISLGWAAAVGFAYDARWSRTFRENNHRLSEITARHIDPDSLLFADLPDRFYGIVEHRARVRVAIPVNDQYRDAGRLLRFHQAHGRRVYAVLTLEWWTRMRQSGALADMEIKPIAQLGPFYLAEIRPHDTSELPSSDP